MRYPKAPKYTPRQEALFAEAERASLRARALGVGAARLLGDFPSKDEIATARELLGEALDCFEAVESARLRAHAIQRNGKPKRK